MEIETYHNFSTVPQLWIDEYISHTRKEFADGCLSMVIVRMSPNDEKGVMVTFLDRSLTDFAFSELARTCAAVTLIAELPDCEMIDGCRCISNKELSDEELDYHIACACSALKQRRVEN